MATKSFFSVQDVYALLGFFVAAYAAKYVYQRVYVAYFGPLSKVPGPKLAALSSIPSLFWSLQGKRFLWIQDKLYPKYGNMIRIAPDMVVVGDKDAIKKIVLTEDLPKQRLYDSFTMVPESQTLFSTRSRSYHKQRRRMLSPAFSIRYLASLEPFMRSCLRELIEKLGSELQDFSSPDGTAIEITELIKNLSLDIIGSTAFGGSFGLVRTGSDHPLPHKIEGELTYRVHRAIMPMFTSVLKHDDYLVQFTTKIIKERRQQTGETRKDILQIMLDAWDDEGTKMSDADIYEQLIEFIIAGSDTIAFSMSYLIRFLVTHPSKLQRLVQELDAELSEYNLDSLSNDQLKSLPYLNACISESMRVRPVAVEGGTERAADKDMVICGYPIPKGTVIIPNVFQLHRAREFWGDDALEYKPERWLDRENIPDDCYYPFSAGSRNCIGMNFALQEMRLITVGLLKSFHFECIPDQIEDIRQEITPKLNSKYYVRMAARK